MVFIRHIFKINRREAEVNLIVDVRCLIKTIINMAGKLSDNHA